MYETRKVLLKSSEPARRRFLQGVAATSLGVSLPYLHNEGQASPSNSSHAAGSSYASADAVIQIILDGGLSHIDTFDIKTRSEMSYGYKAIETNVDGVQVSELLPQFARIMDRVTLIRSMTSNTGAHQSGVYLMRTSFERRGAVIHPHLGTWVSKYQPAENKTLPSYITINEGISGRGFFESHYGALPILDPSQGIAYASQAGHIKEAVHDERLSGLEALNRAFSQTYQKDNIQSSTNSYESALALMQSQELESFDIRKEDQKTKQAYGNSDFGQGCLLARRLVQAGVRFIDVKFGGWDHHSDLPAKLPEQMATLDQVLSTLILDLEKHGLLNRTLVCMRTEFGRRPEIIPSQGRGHNPLAFTTLMAGGGIKRGFVYGKTDELGQKTIDKPVSHSDVAATIAAAIGLNTQQSIKAPSGQPFKVANNGQVIKALFV